MSPEKKKKLKLGLKLKDNTDKTKTKVKDVVVGQFRSCTLLKRCGINKSDRATNRPFQKGTNYATVDREAVLSKGRIWNSEGNPKWKPLRKINKWKKEKERIIAREGNRNTVSVLYANVGSQSAN